MAMSNAPIKIQLPYLLKNSAMPQPPPFHLTGFSLHCLLFWLNLLK
ncbi:hypothetical protein KKC1_17970 [Calderihabitans maritimus]|uniref:Uncharacterized protein n=1 Tax=Calderihabitans maritimus TaxID=1246530 RepID=A0A1Z5HSY3_9FIRM|nr:hypothetical protein KKC1_17970 [Calderihabitans maritimus]